MSEARLIDVQIPRDPHGVVLVLHGGASKPGRPSVSPAQLSVIRMIPVARRIARADAGLAVLRLLNTYRGWDTEHTPVADANHAVDVVRERLGPLPTCLVGHSLGGRAALVAGNHDGVRGVVALNPWVYPSDDARLEGRRVLIVHGTDDRIASPAHARAVADRLARRTDVEFREVDGGKHAMLRHGREFEDAAAAFCADVLGARST